MSTLAGNPQPKTPAKIFLAAAEIIKHPELSHNEIANQAFAQRQTQKRKRHEEREKRLAQQLAGKERILNRSNAIFERIHFLKQEALNSASVDRQRQIWQEIKRKKQHTTYTELLPSRSPEEEFKDRIASENP